MQSFIIVSCALIFFVFSLANFKFISILLLIESFNVLTLLSSFFSGGILFPINFLVFMVVTTIEVTLSLVCLTRICDEFDFFG